MSRYSFLSISFLIFLALEHQLLFLLHMSRCKTEATAIIAKIFSFQPFFCANTLHFHGGFTYIQEKDGASYRYILLLRCLEKPLKTNERNLPHPVYDMLRHSWGCAINIQYTTDGTFSYIHRFQYSKFSRLLSKKRIKQICLLLADWLFSLYRASNQQCKDIKNNWKQGGKPNI